MASETPKSITSTSATKQTPMTAIMAGVNAALPFIIGGGLLLALGNVLANLGLTAVAAHAGHPGNIVWLLNSVGGLGFTLMIPVLGGAIARHLGGNPAVAPAFLASYLANTPALLGTRGGAGFLGAVLIGLEGGYAMRLLRNQVPLPKSMRATVDTLLWPFILLLLLTSSTYFIIGPVLAAVMSGLLHLLRVIPPAYTALGGAIVGGMLAADLGGPLNKTAWLFAFTLLSSHVYTWFGIAGVVPLLAPMSAAIAGWLQPQLFTPTERTSRLSTLLVGMTVASEPAIPYLLTAPVPMIIANVTTGALTGALTMTLHIERIAPGLGVFDPLIGLSRPLGPFYIALTVGLAVNVGLILVLRGMWRRTHTLQN
ncbi:fructose-specific PTS transporter subunit EIIC [Lacticaseibacillus sharpeae]|uniref:PTS system transporter subunits IIBC n=1 Tax=Lacticaseibacillus sharpeae JCM 1186 = DSM 20505 TaxID=1291052 RepID=A0A0R1ZSC4_9LACO|nr:fructose-specific PTS transporter subunit EIIC [Lacticaseibacillus sharpeae]KRM54569.1 PTS system transporter subunits IIBC [Lacticaseibacillus sharpeae JCM 1186 = DSM 20505]